MIKSVFGIGRNKEDARQCVLEATEKFSSPKMILFFSHEDKFYEYSEIMHEMYPDAVCMGCTTYGTWGFWGAQKGMLTALSVESGVTCSAGVIEKADKFALNYADNVKKCLNEIGETENTVCISFTVPYIRAEEYVLMVLNSVLLRNNIPIIGGTASNGNRDTIESKIGYVSLNGKVYNEGSVFMLIHNENGRIYTYRENIFEPLTGREFMVTKANSDTRTVITYGGRPAAEVYAEEVGVPIEKLDQLFFIYPTAQCLGDEVYITAIQEVTANNSMVHLARVHQGTKMMVMKEGDYGRITRETLARVKSDLGDPSLVLMINCYARTVFFETHGYVEEYGRLLSDSFSNFIGFDCLGEQLATKNFNYTMLLVAFE